MSCNNSLTATNAAVDQVVAQVWGEIAPKKNRSATNFDCMYSVNQAMRCEPGSSIASVFPEAIQAVGHGASYGAAPKGEQRHGWTILGSRPQVMWVGHSLSKLRCDVSCLSKAGIGHDSVANDQWARGGQFASCLIH